MTTTTTTLCAIPNCGGKVRARGWCAKHWSLWNRHGDPLGALHYRVCICAKPFVTHDPRERHCSVECRTRVHHNLGAARRAAEVTLIVDDVDRQVVWERDGGVCGICRQPADPNDWELDHIIGLAAGGSHTYDNVRVSCPPCNNARLRPRIVKRRRARRKVAA